MWLSMPSLDFLMSALDTWRYHYTYVKQRSALPRNEDSWAK
jgi:hypothetical protein